MQGHEVFRPHRLLASCAVRCYLLFLWASAGITVGYPGPAMGEAVLAAAVASTDPDTAAPNHSTKPPRLRANSWGPKDVRSPYSEESGHSPMPDTAE